KMLPRSDTINSEEFIFYIDLISDFLKKKQLMKALSNFIKEKDKFNELASYGIVLFQKEENPVNVYDLKDAESLLKTIENEWETREDEHSYLENGLYEILAYIFRKSREARKNYRIIIISDTPSKLSEDYYNALYDLLIKAKKFSAFIDIIRVGDKKFYEDDVKLKVISSETHGGVFYCPNEKHLQNILGSLIQNKKEFKVIKSEELEQVLVQDKIFYERLAVDLISLSPEDQEICDLCESELCRICEMHSDEVHKCYNCNTKFHNCCAAKYSLARNIGFKHIFRCPQCETLLKLDEEFVNMVYEEDLEEVLTEIDIPTPTIETEVEEPIIEEPKIQELEEEKVSIPKPPFSIETKTVKLGGFFGQEIIISKKDTKKDAISETSEAIQMEEEPVSITTLKPPRKKGSGTIKFCKICGTTCGAFVDSCPTCGAKLD
ncbi:MAG: VWA domain-containing protein, partial [Candidatus Lokiarchaeota archaeon]|nr:VWA domain-containing protein [Candidatus Lokiarchaeota archaeon]